MTTASQQVLDERLVEAFLEPIRKCSKYRPAFGRGDQGGVSLEMFQTIYGQDAFYSWLGLTDPLVHAAHKAAGGLTSLYRQIGIGSERLIRAVLAVSYSLPIEEIAWSCEYDKSPREKGVHTLDAFVPLDSLQGSNRSELESWLSRGLASVAAGTPSAKPVEGFVMEVRQGYKSADSKRQNADLRFGVRAYQANLLPVVLVMSGQVSEVVMRRYRSGGMLVLTGLASTSDIENTFVFFRDVVGFDLAGFFERNSTVLHAQIASVVRQLLTPG